MNRRLQILFIDIYLLIAEVKSKWLLEFSTGRFSKITHSVMHVHITAILIVLHMGYSYVFKTVDQLKTRVKGIKFHIGNLLIFSIKCFDNFIWGLV